MDRLDYELAAPRAAAIVESLRAIGYSLPTAIADLVDNSITAGAQNVWLRFAWDGADSVVSITDDGDGMSEKELTEAMRPGALGPLDKRAENDLGRFGLGLKTASFSQCRRLTVASSSRSDGMAVRRWDLDYVVKHDEWRLLKSPAAGSQQRLSALDVMDHGTVVLWECLDRVVGDAKPDNELVHDHFLRAIEDVKLHLEMVFHRFLSGIQPALAIYLNGTDEESRLRPWDPFLEDHPATYSTPVDPISFGGGTVYLEGFVLPHKELLGEEGHRRAAGPAGWNAQQGFYVYRNRRLVVAGSWLGLGADRPWTKEEHYKLARIRVDIPNTMDLAWRLDVKKSSAYPPSQLRPRLKALAGDVRKQAREVFAHRGKSKASPSTKPIERIWRSADEGWPADLSHRQKPSAGEAGPRVCNRRQAGHAGLAADAGRDGACSSDLA